MTSRKESRDEEDSYNTDDEQEKPCSSKKRKVYSQNFRHEWLNVKEFKNWLIPPPQGSTKPKCSVCSVTVVCSKTGIKRHGESASHIRRIKSFSDTSQKKIDFHFTQPRMYALQTESRICAFLAEHNLVLYTKIRGRIIASQILAYYRGPWSTLTTIYYDVSLYVFEAYKSHQKIKLIF